MNTAVIALTVLQNTSSLLPVDELQALGYTVSLIPHRQELARLVNPQNGVQVDLIVGYFDKERPSSFRAGAEKQFEFAVPMTRFRAPSGLSLGTETQYYVNGPSVSFRTRTSWEALAFSARIPRPDAKEPESLDLLEAVARYSLAALAGRRTGAPVRTERSGLRARFADDLKTGTELIALRDWADQRGWTTTFNQRTAVAMLTKGSRSVIVPLAAKQIKVGAEWKDLPDVVRKVGPDVFVPLTGLQAL